MRWVIVKIRVIRGKEFQNELHELPRIIDVQKTYTGACGFTTRHFITYKLHATHVIAP
jgi:hypothetical protein